MAGSNSRQPQFIASTGNQSFSNAPLIQSADTDQIVVPEVSLIWSLYNLLYNLCSSTEGFSQFKTYLISFVKENLYYSS